MARIALISDVHGNLEALEAVLREIDRAQVDRVVCLGDTIDYGPDPRACLEQVSAVADLLLAGNHETEALAPDADRDPAFDAMILWTLRALEGSPAWDAMLARVSEHGAAAACVVERDLHFVHASAGAPTAQYVWPAHEAQYLLFNDQVDAHLAGMLDDLAAPIGWCGHTHVPALLVDYASHGLFDPYTGLCNRDAAHTFVGPRTIFFVPTGDRTVIRGLDGRRAFINPGSVGQPRRLRDNRASFALFDGDTLELRRVAYDWRRTAKKLQRTRLPRELRSFLAERLSTGL